jgi:hypothetical protein
MPLRKLGELAVERLVVAEVGALSLPAPAVELEQNVQIRSEAIRRPREAVAHVVPAAKVPLAPPHLLTEVRTSRRKEVFPLHPPRAENRHSGLADPARVQQRRPAFVCGKLLAQEEIPVPILLTEETAKRVCGFASFGRSGNRAEVVAWPVADKPNHPHAARPSPVQGQDRHKSISGRTARGQQ